MNFPAINLNNNFSLYAPKINFRGQRQFYDSFEPVKKLFNKNEQGEWTAIIPFGHDNNYTLNYAEDVNSALDNENQLPYPPSSIKFKTPVDFNNALKVFKKYNSECVFSFLDDKNQFDIFKDFLKNSDFKDEKVSSLIYAVAKTIVIELQDGCVLKMTGYNPFEKRPYEPSFDMPIMSDICKYRNYYIYTQEKADLCRISDDDTDNIEDRIQKAGYKPYDLHKWQIGFSPSLNRVMLLDSECAQPAAEQLV